MTFINAEEFGLNLALKKKDSPSKHERAGATSVPRCALPTIS